MFNRITGISLGGALLASALILAWQRHSIDDLRSEMSLLKERVSVRNTDSRLSSSLKSGEERAPLAPNNASKEERHRTPDRELSEARHVLNKLIEQGKDIESAPLVVIQNLPALIRSVEDLDTSGMLTIAGGYSSDGIEGLLRMLLFEMAAEKSPESLLSNQDLMANEPELHAAALVSLARTNPEAAAREFDGLTIELKEATSAAISLQLLNRDTKRGLTFLQTVDASDAWSKGTSRVLKLTLKDPQKRAEVVAALKEGIDPRFGERRLTEPLILETLKEETVQSARDLLSEIPMSLNRDEFVFQTAGDLKETNPEQAMSWIMEAATPKGRSQILSQMIGVWAKRDFNAAGEWLGTQSPSPEKDAAITAYTDKIVSVDPEAALVWAAQIDQLSHRESVRRELFNHWTRQDQIAANQWLTSQDSVAKALLND